MDCVKILTTINVNANLSTRNSKTDKKKRELYQSGLKYFKMTLHLSFNLLAASAHQARNTFTAKLGHLIKFNAY